MRHGGRAIALLVAAPLLLLALGLWTGGRAEAHALLVRSDPPINAAVREAPRVINLFMSESLQQEFSSIEVLDSQGRRVDLGALSFNDQDPTNVSILLGPLDAGIYTVVWHTLSAVDAHTWNGSYSFTVLNPDGSAPLGTAFTPDLSSPGPPASADAAVKWFSLLAVIAILGAALFAHIAQRAARLISAQSAPFLRIAREHAWAVATYAVALLLLTTTYDAASAALKLGGLEFLDETLFDTRSGSWLLTRWSILILASVLVIAAHHSEALRRSPASLAALAILTAGLIATFSNISHGAAIDHGAIWATLFDAVHLGAVAVWIGMLAAMLWAFWSTRTTASAPERRRFRVESVRRFSWVAAAVVPILATAGVLSVLVQVPAWRGFTDTDWGIAMIVKFGLLAVLFAIAAANAVLLRPRAERSAGRSDEQSALERHFRILMRTELVVALAVIAATAALTQLPSPRSELPGTAGEQKDRSFEQTLILADLTTTLRVEPNLVGSNRYQVSFDTSAASLTGDPISEVRLHFRYEDPSVGPVVIPAEPENDGRFALEGAFFGLAGEWTVDVEVRRRVRDDAINGVTITVEQGFIDVLPFGFEPPGALALPLTQFDWDSVAAIWAALFSGLLIAYRKTIRERLSGRAADAAVVGGAVFMSIAVILALSVELSPGRHLQNPIERSEASVAQGAVLFAANCTQCHGDSGLGNGPLTGTLPAPPANFRVHVPFHPDGTLFTWISDGIRGTGMPSFNDTLDPQQRWDLVNFLRENFDRPAR